MADFLKLIPEIFYDLLVRLTPGLVFLSLIAISLGGSPGDIVEAFVKGSVALRGSTFVAVSVLVVAGFVAGHLIAGVSDVVRTKILERIFPKNYSVLEDALGTGLGGYPPAVQEALKKEVQKLYGDEAPAETRQVRRALHLWQDALLRGDKEIETRVRKVRAEQRMLEGVFVASTAALIAYGVRVSLDAGARPVHWLLLGGLAVTAALSAWRSARLYRDYSWAVINHFYESNVTAAQQSSSNTTTPGEGNGTTTS